MAESRIERFKRFQRFQRFQQMQQQAGAAQAAPGAPAIPQPEQIQPSPPVQTAPISQTSPQAVAAGIAPQDIASIAALAQAPGGRAPTPEEVAAFEASQPQSQIGREIAQLPGVQAGRELGLAAAREGIPLAATGAGAVLGGPIGAGVGGAAGEAAVQAMGLRDPSAVGVAVSALPGVPGLLRPIGAALRRTRAGRLVGGRQAVERAKQLGEKLFSPSREITDRRFGLLRQSQTGVNTSRAGQIISESSESFNRTVKGALRKADVDNVGLADAWEMMAATGKADAATLQKMRSTLRKLRPGGPAEADISRKIGQIVNSIDDDIDEAIKAGNQGATLIRQANEASHRLNAAEDMSDLVQNSLNIVGEGQEVIQISGKTGLRARIAKDKLFNKSIDKLGVRKQLEKDLDEIEKLAKGSLQVERDLERSLLERFKTPAGVAVGPGAVGAGLATAGLPGAELAAIAGSGIIVSRVFGEVLLSPVGRRTFKRVLENSGGRVTERGLMLAFTAARTGGVRLEEEETRRGITAGIQGIPGALGR